jgi:hypothetical protein
MTRHDIQTTKHGGDVSHTPSITAAVLFERREKGVLERRVLCETGFYWTIEEAVAAALQLLREKNLYCGCSTCRHAVPPGLRNQGV